MQTDPISDLLTQIRNAIQVGHAKIDVPMSRMKMSLIEILKSNGFIKDYKLFRKGAIPILRVYLKYINKNESAIQGLKRISKPSLRVYLSYRKIPKIRDGYGKSILSTSKGIMTDEEARNQKIGGEIICSVW